MMPIGISDDDRLLAAMSATSMKIAPSRIDIGSSFQWLVPTSARAMWGMMSPTNPMIPQLLTMKAMMTDVRIM